MSTTMIVIGSILIGLAVFLVICVLMQQSKDRSLSGAIAGGNDNFGLHGKEKKSDKILARATLIVAILFTLIVTLLYVLQPVTDFDKYIHQNSDKVTSPMVIREDMPWVVDSLKNANTRFPQKRYVV